MIIRYIGTEYHGMKQQIKKICTMVEKLKNPAVIRDIRQSPETFLAWCLRVNLFPLLDGLPRIDRADQYTGKVTTHQIVGAVRMTGWPAQYRTNDGKAIPMAPLVWDRYHAERISTVVHLTGVYRIKAQGFEMVLENTHWEVVE